MRFCPVPLLLSAFCVVAVPVWSDNEICLVTAVDATVENGVGAEPGVEREFVQDLDVPLECQTIAGNTWILAHELRVTRVDPSNPTVNAQVTVRKLEAVRDVQPGHPRSWPGRLWCRSGRISAAVESLERGSTAARFDTHPAG